MAEFLNIGCGKRFCNDSTWLNMDFNTTFKEVISHDVLKGLPFEDCIFDIVYHSHVLEHFDKNNGWRLMRECFRVLKPGGIARVVVPDLENISKLYLEALEKALAGDEKWQRKYDWIMLEMYDQAVRSEPGGEMAKYLCSSDILDLDKEFIISRIGSIGRSAVEPTVKIRTAISITKKLAKVPIRLRRFILSGFLNKYEKKAVDLAFFMLSGEAHQWMYDRYSLSRLLREVGFEDVRHRSAGESGIPGWSAYHLDIDEDGFLYAPSSLYMEGVKPG